MDEKIGKNPNHKCVCKDTHPGMGPHRDCKKRGYHLCGCGNRSTLTNPSRWVTREMADASFNQFVGMVMATMFQTPAEEALAAAVENCHHNRNEPPHYHVYAYGNGGQFHLCLKAQQEDEEEAAKAAAGIAEFLHFGKVELIHVGGGNDAFHSSSVESGSTFQFGSIRGSRLN